MLSGIRTYEHIDDKVPTFMNCYWFSHSCCSAYADVRRLAGSFSSIRWMKSLA